MRDAWRIYVRERLSKGLPNSEKPLEGEEDAAFSRICDSIENPDWKQECLKRDEKFDMHFSSAVRRFCHILKLLLKRLLIQRRCLNALQTAHSQLGTSNVGLDVTHQLIEDSRDILAISLDAQVCISHPRKQNLCHI